MIAPEEGRARPSKLRSHPPARALADDEGGNILPANGDGPRQACVRHEPHQLEQPVVRNLHTPAVDGMVKHWFDSLLGLTAGILATGRRDAFAHHHHTPLREKVNPVVQPPPGTMPPLVIA